MLGLLRLLKVPAIRDVDTLAAATGGPQPFAALVSTDDGFEYSRKDCVSVKISQDETC